MFGAQGISDKSNWVTILLENCTNPNCYTKKSHLLKHVSTTTGLEKFERANTLGRLDSLSRLVRFPDNSKLF